MQGPLNVKFVNPSGYYWPPGPTSNDPSFRPQGVCNRHTALPQTDEIILRLALNDIHKRAGAFAVGQRMGRQL
jgi:hypothetical protein